MKYLLIYMWKLIYLIVGIVILVGTLILGVEVSKTIPDFMLLKMIVIGTVWVGGSFILIKLLTLIDKFFEAKASLDKDARIEFFVFMTLVLISLAVFVASIYLFNEWLELINDIVNRTLDDYFTIIFPLVLFVASIASLVGSFKLYKKYQDTIEKKDSK